MCLSVKTVSNRYLLHTDLEIKYYNGKVSKFEVYALEGRAKHGYKIGKSSVLIKNAVFWFKLPLLSDLIFSETISKGEVTFYEPTNGSTPHFPQVNGITPGVQLNGVHSDEEVEVSQLSLREQIQKSAIKSVSPTSPTSFTS